MYKEYVIIFNYNICFVLPFPIPIGLSTSANVRVHDTYIYILNLQALNLITFSAISKENFESNLGETVKKGDTN